MLVALPLIVHDDAVMLLCSRIQEGVWLDRCRGRREGKKLIGPVGRRASRRTFLARPLIRIYHYLPPLARSPRPLRPRSSESRRQSESTPWRPVERLRSCSVHLMPRLHDDSQLDKCQLQNIRVTGPIDSPAKSRYLTSEALRRAGEMIS